MNIKEPMAILIAWAVVILAIYASIPFVFAGDYRHHSVPDVNNYYTTEVTEAYTDVTNEAETADGVAAAIASSQLNFDYDTPAFQVSAGLGNFEDNTAWAIGGAQRVGKLLINGSITNESNKTGYGVGATMRFR